MNEDKKDGDLRPQDTNALKSPSAGENAYETFAETQMRARLEQLKKNKEQYKIFNRWRDFDFITTILAMSGLTLAVINYEFEIGANLEPIDIEAHPSPMTLPRVKRGQTNLVRLIIMITTILSIICLVTRHYFRVVWLNAFQSTNNLQGIFQYYNEALVGTGLPDYDSTDGKHKLFTPQLILEVLILCLSPIPYFDAYVPFENKFGKTGYYLLSELMVAFMWLRMYFLIRTIFNYSIYGDALSKKICKSYGVEANVPYIIKCQILVNPGVSITTLFFGSLFISAYIIRIVELPFFRMTGVNELDSFLNANYMVIITLTTVGYGDLSPGTPVGRLLIMTVAVIGAFIIGLLVVVLQSIFNLNQEQSMALSHIHLQRRAALTIQASMKYFVAKKRLYELKLQLEPQFVHRSMFMQHLVREQGEPDVSSKRSRTAINDDDVFESVQSSPSERPAPVVPLIPKKKGKLSNLELATQVEFLAKNNLIDYINQFYAERISLQKLVREKNNTASRDTRMIKAEVLEMADRVESMEKIITELPDTLLKFGDRLERIERAQRKAAGEDVSAEEQEEEPSATQEEEESIQKVEESGEGETVSENVSKLSVQEVKNSNRYIGKTMNHFDRSSSSSSAPLSMNATLDNMRAKNLASEAVPKITSVDNFINATSLFNTTMFGAKRHNPFYQNQYKHHHKPKVPKTDLAT